MPTVLKIGPYRFFFFSNEGTEPAHIHVESAGSYAKYWIPSCELAKSGGYNSHELTKVHDLVFENAELFLERWNEYFDN